MKLLSSMKCLGPLFGIAIAFFGHNAIAKNRLTDPLKIARECKTEAELFCKDVRAGSQRIVTCLKSKATELSPACTAVLKASE